MTLSQYTKAIMAAVAAIGAIATAFFPDTLSFTADPKWQMAISAALAPILVLLFANSVTDKQVVEVERMTEAERRAAARRARAE